MDTVIYFTGLIISLIALPYFAVKYDVVDKKDDIDTLLMVGFVIILLALVWGMTWAVIAIIAMLKKFMEKK